VRRSFQQLKLPKIDLNNKNLPEVAMNCVLRNTRLHSHLIATACVLLLIPISAQGNPLDLRSKQTLDTQQTVESISMNQADNRNANNAISPFEIAISDAELEDLSQRLALTRLPDYAGSSGLLAKRI